MNVDTQTKAKLREMGAAELVRSLEAQDDSVCMGMAFADRLQAAVDEAYSQFVTDKVSGLTKRAKLRYPEADIMVTGCYAQLRPEEVASLEGVAVVAGNDRKGELTDFLRRWLADRQPQTHVASTAELLRFVPSCSRGDRTRYFLKVQDGCNYYCTYCTIPIARGR